MYRIVLQQLRKFTDQLYVEVHKNNPTNLFCS